MWQSMLAQQPEAWEAFTANIFLSSVCKSLNSQVSINQFQDSYWERPRWIYADLRLKFGRGLVLDLLLLKSIMLAYAIAALKTLAIARRLVAFIQIDDKVEIHRRTLQIAVGKGRHDGGDLSWQKMCCHRDQRLELTAWIFPTGSIYFSCCQHYSQCDRALYKILASLGVIAGKT